jgi:ATP-binding cassette subfamily B (MDR/TAP) protein 1
MRMKVLYLKSMLRQEIGWFDLDENNLDVLVKRLSSDAIALKGLIDSTFGGICNAIGALSVALFISFINGWKLTLVIFCLTSLMVLAGLIKDQQFFKSVGKKKASTSDSEEGGKVCLIKYRFLKIIN